MARKKQHKVVINNDYGGFHLSSEAVRWLEENAEDQELRDFLVEARKKSKEADNLWSTEEDLMQYDIIYNFNENGIPRHHKDLVAVVEALGKKASGMCAALKVAKIKGNVYRIHEYDGWESVMEPEDYDWITIPDE